MQKIKEPGVNGFDLAGSMIPQDIINAYQSLWAIVTPAKIAGLKAFSGMGVVKGKVFLGSQNACHRCENSCGEKINKGCNRCIL
jgi:hypothetical protein